MGSITLRTITKKFGQRQVLHDINMTVQEGEFVVVVGPSGCGKSTLLRIVAGLESPSSGDLEFDGRVVTRVPPHERNIGMVFQNYALYPHMSVFDNLAFGMTARRTSRDVIQQRISEVAALLEIGSLLKSKPGALSGGQRQRVAVGRALVRSPYAFLMDEPLSNLDALLRERMRVELRRLHDQVRIPTLYVTHDQTEAMTMADRIVVMRDGRILQAGTPEEVYSQPNSVFVAQFLGSPPMNLVRVARRPDACVVLEGSEGIAAAVPDWIRRSPSSAWWLGFRPERIERSHNGSSGLDMTASIRTIETLGARYHVHANWGGFPITWVTQDVSGLMPGSPVSLTVSWDHIHWFDRNSEQRVTESADFSFPLEAGGVR